MSAPAAFDPWCASAEEALQARNHADQKGGAPDPLGQYHAARQVSVARDECLSSAGGCAVLRCLSLCLLHSLRPPQWLSDAFVQRHSRVIEAEVGSWDDAFGAPWPPRTRLDTVRRHRKLKQAIHTAVWDRIAKDPQQPVNRDLFEQIGEQRAISASGSQVEKLYQESLRAGMPNPLHVFRHYHDSAQKRST